jgi:hypothetical protein
MWTLFWLFNRALRYYTRHGQSACPPTYFFGPWAFFLLWEKAILYINLLLQEIWSKVKGSIKVSKEPNLFLLRRNCDFFITYFEFWIVRPAMKNSFQIWPAIKKAWPPLYYTFEIFGVTGGPYYSRSDQVFEKI